MEIKATAKHTGVSARKVRLILEHLPGKRVEEALGVLQFIPSPNARLVAKVVKSAAANAENNFQMSSADLRIKAAYAGEARRLKRFRPRPRGRAGQVRRPSSHITIVVEEQEA
jgi:large subunit ribosomal protein L22